ncbi:MAG: dienelactone hydrolase family protein [Pseudomonadales bacterium]|nr:dienelactone hydrolase family protein [Pseudomonadales bacterium]MCP5184899.1 dienelactone hydrolase family protein [Pseudomonadales bacterium]
MGEQIQLTADDGFTFGAYQSLPGGRPRGAVVVIQEIFGVNNHIREVTDGYAAAGYAAIAPQIFDRVRPNIELGYTGDDMQAGIKLAFQDLSRDRALGDIQTAVDHIARHGKVGVVGYCFGGLLTWLSACTLKGISAASSYYGGGVVNETGRKASCPVIMHFGERDAHIPMSDVEQIKAALPQVTVYVYAADHGFNCDHRDSYDASAAATAKTRTLAFFAQHLA